jgi:hypothetical protein
MNLLYFAYGSNLSTPRLCARVASAECVAVATLARHALRFHKRGRDGSAKADACLTGDTRDRVLGVVFRIAARELSALDRCEGCGRGYDRHRVSLVLADGTAAEAFTYRATDIAPDLRPFTWYREHVLRGAREHRLDAAYVRAIEQVAVRDDPDRARHASELSVYRVSRPGGQALR